MLLIFYSWVRRTRCECPWLVLCVSTVCFALAHHQHFIVVDLICSLSMNHLRSTVTQSEARLLPHVFISGRKKHQIFTLINQMKESERIIYLIIILTAAASITVGQLAATLTCVWVTTCDVMSLPALYANKLSITETNTLHVERFAELTWRSKWWRIFQRQSFTEFIKFYATQQVLKLADL